jgi:hypothetical protein
VAILVLALLAWLAPSLHIGKGSAEEVNPFVVERQVPRVDSGWLLATTNARRRDAGLPALASDRAASLMAQEQSARMADAGRLLTIPTRDLQPFRFGGSVAQAEFQYEGGSVPISRAQLFHELMKGKRARRYALAGRFNRVGIGVTRRLPSLWVELIFIRA